MGRSGPRPGPDPWTQLLRDLEAERHAPPPQPRRPAPYTSASTCTWDDSPGMQAQRRRDAYEAFNEGAEAVPFDRGRDRMVAPVADLPTSGAA